MNDWQMDDFWQRAGMPNCMPWPDRKEEQNNGEKNEEPAK